MYSYTENEIKKGQAAPDLFVMVITQIGQTVSDLFGVAKKIHQTVSAESLSR